MRWTLQDAMRWLHTWGGVTTGLILMIVFLMGTLSVFSDELDRWMIPQTRLPPVAAPLSLDDNVLPVIAQATPPGSQLRYWWAKLPGERSAVMHLRLKGEPFGDMARLADPRTGSLLPDAGTFAASDFFVPLHYHLHLFSTGQFLVGLAAMLMLAALVSGIIIHARIFRDFFSLRLGKELRRSVLDLHNLTGVLVLPFHLLITFSGLIILFAFYLPSAMNVLYPEEPDSFYTEWFSYYQRPPAMQPAPLASLDEMAAVARSIYKDSTVDSVLVYNPGDANAYVQILLSNQHAIDYRAERVYFDGPSGAVLQSTSHLPVAKVQRFITSLHVLDIDSYVLRWLYFLSGLAGCVLIATGMLYWIEKRRVQHAGQGRRSLAVVAGIACAAITGLPLATLSMLLTNRILPLLLDGRAWIEVRVFFAVWLLSALHGITGALWRRDGSVPWRTQCGLIAVLALGCVVANAVSTGDHLLRTLTRGDWAVAGTDLMLLATAAIAAYAMWRLARRADRKAVKVRHV